MTEATINSLDQLLGANLDDLADLPSFETPTPGVYILDVTFDTKEVNDKPVVDARWTVVEAVELKDAEAVPPIAGSQFNTMYTLNEVGVGKLKQVLLPFAAHFNTKSVQELIRDHIKGVRVSAKVTNRKDKTDPDKVYAGVEVFSVA